MPYYELTEPLPKQTRAANIIPGTPDFTKEKIRTELSACHAFATYIPSL